MISKTNNFSFSKKHKWEIALFILSICCAAYWIIGNRINVYQHVIIGVAFEILWLPMILLMIGIPVLSVIAWIKERFALRSLYPFNILIFIALILILKFSI